tara:strand:+ start:291 stop:857 length:567 start_codon:yes stop_codon:yes gene_type:complete
MKAKVKRLLELLEHNTHSLWDSNLQDTTDCIILEDKELKDMVYEENTEELDFKNHVFNGNELCKLIEELKKEVSDHESNSLSPDRPYIRYKTSVLKQMLMSGNVPSEILIEKELNLREDKLVYAVEKYLHTSEPKIFETDRELAKWLRSRGVDENNELSDEYIINESISIGEIKQVKRKDIANPNTRN